MDQSRERALTLAHEAEAMGGYIDAKRVLERARAYLDFLEGNGADKNGVNHQRLQAAIQ